MKYFVITLLILSITLPAIAQLTSDDLIKIQEIVDKSIKTSETRMKEHIDIKFESVEQRFKGIDTRFDDLNKRFDSFDNSLGRQANMTYALIALIAIAIIPQYIFLFRSRTDEALKKQVETLTQEIEILKKQRITSP